MQGFFQNYVWEPRSQDLAFRNSDSDHGEDDDDEPDPEEDSERTQDSEHQEGNNSKDEDNASEECKKEQFFYFVFDAEEFLDSEYKEMMEELVENRKKHYKDGGYDYENTDDIPHDINEVIDDVR